MITFGLLYELLIPDPCSNLCCLDALGQTKGFVSVKGTLLLGFMPLLSCIGSMYHLGR